jgi:hypothetical protein
MNKDLQELIETAARLSERLDSMANDEKRFTSDISLFLEKMSWDIFAYSEDLQEIKSYCED